MQRLPDLRSSSRSRNATFSWLVAVPCLIVVLSRPATATPLNVYSVGNSLTVDLRASGGLEFLSRYEPRQVTHDYHPRCGSSLTGIVANITDTCVSSFHFGKIMGAFSPEAPWQIDVVTLQPFYGATIRQEVTAARSLIEIIRASAAGADARILVYATWPSQSDGPLHEAWGREDITMDSFFRPSRKAYELFLDAVREFEPNVSLIPAGHAWVAVSQASVGAGAFEGIRGPSDLYRDDIHASNLGRYIAGLAAYASIYGKSPDGLGNSWMYSLTGYGPIPLYNDLPKLQEITWQSIQAVPEPKHQPALMLIAGVLGALSARLRKSSNRKGFA